jgi:hypothetical protein
MQQTLKMRNDGYAAYSAHDFIWDFYARHQGLEMNFVAKRNCLLFRVGTKYMGGEPIDLVE